MSRDSRFEGILWNCPQDLSEEEKAQARANMGVGSGGGDVVVMRLADVLPDISDAESVPAQDNTQLWEDMIDVILDGKVLVVAMVIGDGVGSYAPCETYFEVPDGYTREEFKSLLRSHDELGTLTFTFDVSMYGGLMTAGAQVNITPSKGIVPFYFYTRMGSGIILEASAVQSSTALAGLVFGFEYDDVEDTYNVSYSNLPHILTVLQNHGEHLLFTGMNKDGSYLLYNTPVRATMAYNSLEQGTLLLEASTLAQYAVTDAYDGESRPVLWRGTFVYDGTVGSSLQGMYVFESDQTYVMDFTVIDTSTVSDNGR